MAKKKKPKQPKQPKKKKLSKLAKAKLDSNSKLWRNKADKLWSELVRRGGKCEVCGREEFLDAHHLLDRFRYKHFRHILANGICLCKSCHKHGTMSFHKSSIWAGYWLETNKPEQYKWVVEHFAITEHSFDYKLAYEQLLNFAQQNNFLPKDEKKSTS